MVVNKSALRIAARWGFKVAMEGYNPPIPSWVYEWGGRSLRLAYREMRMPAIKDPLEDVETFKTARDSLEALLPNLLSLLHRTLKDQFHMNASADKNRIYYYFASKDPLENLALTLGIKGHMAYLSMLYVPMGLNGAADYKKAIEFRDLVDDPELAGLAMMRLARKVLGQAVKTHMLESPVRAVGAASGNKQRGAALHLQQG